MLTIKRSLSVLVALVSSCAIFYMFYGDGKSNSDACIRSFWLWSMLYFFVYIDPRFHHELAWFEYECRCGWMMIYTVTYIAIDVSLEPDVAHKCLLFATSFLVGMLSQSVDI